MADDKPFKVWIRWGCANTQEEVYESPRDANEYSFATEAELAAFMFGVNEADGWLEADVFDTKEELDQEPESWEYSAEEDDE